MLVACTTIRGARTVSASGAEARPQILVVLGSPCPPTISLCPQQSKGPRPRKPGRGGPAREDRGVEFQAQGFWQARHRFIGLLAR
jgi:hypothetical protein